jgi:hypothetical protein
MLNNLNGVGIQRINNPISINKKDALELLKSQYNIFINSSFNYYSYPE